MVVELFVRPRLELGLCQSAACHHAANPANPPYRKELTMPELKTKASDASVEKFLHGSKDEKRRQDCYQILKIMKKATKAEPKMWGTAVIGFGDYHYKYESGRENDWFPAGFSPRVQSLTLYMMGGFDKEVLKKLGKYKTGKGCLYINKLEDVDLKVLNEWITQFVKQSEANVK
jgi:uncharacterized protein DUF1801